MPTRGRAWAVYVSDDDVAYARLVDQDAIAEASRGWSTDGVELLQAMPRGARARRVRGVSASTGRSGSAVCATVTSDLWTFTTTTFDVEATDGTTDTMTTTARERERIPHPHA